MDLPGNMDDKMKDKMNSTDMDDKAKLKMEQMRRERAESNNQSDQNDSMAS